jgi:hypothetical protein
MAKRAMTASIAHYPEGVTTLDDRREYDAFLEGLPLVNELFFRDSLTKVFDWVDGKLLAITWGDLSQALSFIASYVGNGMGAGRPEKDLANLFLIEARKELPDRDGIVAAQSALQAWANRE